jgi:hypothetical protein
MGKFYARELNLGQTNVLLGVTLVSALLAAERGRAVVAGALAGSGIFVKPYAAILLLWLPWNAGLPGVLSAGVALAGGLTLPAVLYGWQGNLDLLFAWYRTVTESTAPNLLGADNVSLASTWAKWVGAGATASWLAALTSAATLGVVGWVIRQRQRVPSPGYLEFGMLMLLVPLISPQGWDYVLLLGTPAIVCLADRFGTMTMPWKAVAALAAVFMSFTIFDVLGRALYGRLMAVNIVSACALVLFVCLAHLRRRAEA